MNILIINVIFVSMQLMSRESYTTLGYFFGRYDVGVLGK